MYSCLGLPFIKPVKLQCQWTGLPVSAVCPWREIQTDLGCSWPSQPCLYDPKHASTASRSLHDEIQTWPVDQKKTRLSPVHVGAHWPESCNDVPITDLNRPKGFIISPLPSGEQQTDNLLNIVAWPKDEVHLLCAAYHILQQQKGKQCWAHTSTVTPKTCHPWSPTLRIDWYRGACSCTTSFCKSSMELSRE